VSKWLVDCLTNDVVVVGVRKQICHLTWRPRRGIDYTGIKFTFGWQSLALLIAVLVIRLLPQRETSTFLKIVLAIPFSNHDNNNDIPVLLLPNYLCFPLGLGWPNISPRPTVTHWKCLKRPNINKKTVQNEYYSKQVHGPKAFMARCTKTLDQITLLHTCASVSQKKQRC